MLYTYWVVSDEFADTLVAEKGGAYFRSFRGDFSTIYVSTTPIEEGADVKFKETIGDKSGKASGSES